MKKYIFLLSLLFIGLLSCNEFLASNKEKNTKPNFIIIVADDAGYSDIGFFGSEIATPNLDFMAKNGTVCPNFYNFSRCSPSRASLMTGLYPHKVGMGELSGRSLEYGLPGYLGYLGFEYPTITEVLGKVGYHNIMCGKWHLGNESEKSKTPLGRGFHDFFGLNRGEASHFNVCENEKSKYYLQDNIYEDCDDDFYSSDMFADMAIQFIENNNSEKPFLLYLPYTAPHHPIEAPKDVVKKYRKTYTINHSIEKIARNRVKKLSQNINIDPEDYIYPKMNKKTKQKYIEEKKEASTQLATRAAMIHVMDEGIGRILDYLKEKSIDDNTIIFYFSDNGGGTRFASKTLVNAPYKGYKTSMQEGGIKTPLIIYGKDIPRGKINDNLISVMDIFPSILSMIDTPFEGHQDIDDIYKGVDVTQAILGNKKVNREYLFWDLYGQQAAIKDGKWKWINDKKGKDQLFDIENDPMENHNIAAKHTQIISQIKKKHRQFRKTNNVEPYPDIKRMKKRKSR